MKTVFLHGLGQTAGDWEVVRSRILGQKGESLALFAPGEEGDGYGDILLRLEERLAQEREPLRLCGLSLGGVLALDYAGRHREKVAALVLIGVQYKTPRLLVGIQNMVFRLLPARAFEGMGVSKKGVLRLMRSMASLDLRGRLGMVTCPVALVCGEKDRANKNASKKLKKLLPQAELYIISGAGHEVNRCAPESIGNI